MYDYNLTELNLNACETLLLSHCQSDIPFPRDKFFHIFMYIYI